MPAAPMSPHDALIVAGTLAFTAGFADAATYVGADGIFCAHVTGNFVVLAADLARHADADEWLKLATFPVFVAAVLAATWLGRSTHGTLDTSTVRRLLAVKAALLGAAAIVGVAWGAARGGVGRAVIVALLVTAMAIQNALHRLRPTLGAMTTVMTGNVTSWLVGLVTPSTPEDAAKRRTLGLVIVLFGVGCISGACSVAAVGFGAVAGPAAMAMLARSRVH